MSCVVVFYIIQSGSVQHWTAVAYQVSQLSTAISGACRRTKSQDDRVRVSPLSFVSTILILKSCDRTADAIPCRSPHMLVVCHRTRCRLLSPPARSRLLEINQGARSVEHCGHRGDGVQRAVHTATEPANDENALARSGGGAAFEHGRGGYRESFLPCRHRC